MRLLSFAVGTTCGLVVMYYTGFLLLGVDMNEMSVTLIDFEFPCSSFCRYVRLYSPIAVSLQSRMTVCTAISLAAYQG